jgi:hypothetical protein
MGSSPSPKPPNRNRSSHFPLATGSPGRRLKGLNERGKVVSVVSAGVADRMETTNRAPYTEKSVSEEDADRLGPLPHDVVDRRFGLNARHGEIPC